MRFARIGPIRSDAPNPDTNNSHISKIDSVAEEVEHRKSTNDMVMVFVFGGVGPLHSDVSVAGVAKAFGVRLAPDEEFEEYLRLLIGDHCTGDRNEMALLPEGITELLHNEILPVPLIKCQNVIILTATNVCELDKEWGCLLSLLNTPIEKMPPFASKHLSTMLSDRAEDKLLAAEHPFDTDSSNFNKIALNTAQVELRQALYGEESFWCQKASSRASPPPVTISSLIALIPKSHFVAGALEDEERGLRTRCEERKGLEQGGSIFFLCNVSSLDGMDQIQRVLHHLLELGPRLLEHDGLIGRVLNLVVTECHVVF
ncbi:hypothetical protein Taro_000690 [Colocasia esculenta]|uniref:Uncharacterized protein n=1 Tax=Colocasia esculenta TaxID=4460 RepID=A0A843TIF9_COLES|nr:hypothetical protein [Colocasia esculenta]